MINYYKSMEVLEILKNKLGKPYNDLEYLLTCLHDVLIENGEEEMAASIPWLYANNDISLSFSHKHLHLYSICFQLLNLVETNGAVQNRRKKENHESLDALNGLWANSLQILKQHNISEKQIAEKLSSICVQPVLTAHPTEAKRPVVLKLYRELYLLMVRRENPMYNKYEADQNSQQIKQLLTRIWFVDEIYIEKPNIESELNNVIHYFEKVFPEVLPILYQRFEQAWNFVGFNSKKLIESENLPRIKFGNWVGGDRDGHPLVTGDVTRMTLSKLRLSAMVVLQKELTNLADNVSFYAETREFAPVLAERHNQLLRELDKKGQTIIERNSNEAFKQYVLLLIEKLPISVSKNQDLALKERKTSYKYSYELIQDLEILKKGLNAYGAYSLSEREVNQTILLIRTVGFHLAELDIRQNSKYYHTAFEQLINISQVCGDDYSKLTREQKLKFINKELYTNRPFARNWHLLPTEARSMLDCFHVLDKHINSYSHFALGSLIVSMTRNINDLLVVYLLQRETGLTLYEDKVISKLHVVPLFETIEDLIQSPEIMEQYFRHPVVKQSLEYQAKVKNRDYLEQEIMIGYSDSNKDGGILASVFYLNLAQKQLTKVGRKYNIRIKFFHGKGGTISRGAGPLHWFLKALPNKTLSGSIKVTEQGETIEKKYANKINAAYNLELLMAGTTLNTLLHEYSSPKDDGANEAMEYLAAKSKEVYSELLRNEYFIPFYDEATPIDVIEQSKIGSRPSRRTGKRSFEDLRAIPWVFSWSQSRYHITSWYGVGSTLETMLQSEPDKYSHLKSLIPTNNYIRYVLTNIDTSLASTDEEIMKLYASLVTRPEIKDTILTMLLNELDKTRKHLAQLLNRPMEQRRTNHYYSTMLRAEALKPLHTNQVELIRTWRNSTDRAGKKELLIRLYSSVNAIANAMGTTG